MKKRLLWFLPALMAVMAVAVPTTVLAAVMYYIPVVVANSGAGNDYDILPIIESIGNDQLAVQGYIDSSGNDTRVVYSGSELKHMVVDDRLAFAAEDVNHGVTYNYQYTMGNDPLGYFAIIPGYGGSISRADTPNMELANSFTIEQKGYVDTSAGSNKNLVYKLGAFRSYISAEGNIRSAILGYSTDYPTVAAVNGGNDVVDQTNHTVNLPSGIMSGNLLIVPFASDGNPTITFPEGWTQLFQTANGTAVKVGAWYRIADGTEGATITVTTSASEMTAHTSYRITGYSGVPEAGTPATGTTTYPDPPSLTPSWGSQATLWFALAGKDNGTIPLQLYPTNYTNGRYDNSNNAAGVGVGSARRELTAVSEDPSTFTWSSSEEWVANTVAICPAWGLTEKEAVTATGITSGVRKVITTAAPAGNLTISVYDENNNLIDDDAVALNGASVPNNNNTWYFMQNNVMPYMDYYKHTTAVGGTSLKAWYQPNTMIIGTQLPDMSGNTNHATFSWGSNPGTVSVSHGALQILNLQQMTEEEEQGALQLFGEVPTEPGGFYNAENYGALPGSSVINELATAGQIPLKLFWVPMLFMIVIAIGLVVYGKTRHIMGVAIGSCIVLGIFCGVGMLPWWVMIPYVILSVTMIVSEKSYGF